MSRKKKIPDRPRFEYVTQTAYKFLIECGYSRFPISPYDVLNELEDYVVCLPWSKAKKVMKSEDPFHLRQLKAEGRTIRMRGTGMYYIVYDDVTVNSSDRIAWTIMHEIGHIILGHLVEFSETALNRGGITSEQYGVLEVEAHYFAAEFLMPTAILKYYKRITVDEIVLLFGVSEKAAKKKYKRVFESNYHPTGEYDRQIMRNFFKFLMTEADEAIYRSIYRTWGIPWKTKYVSVRRKCPACYSYIDDPKAEYCPYCGGTIERNQMYRNMFERLRSQQEFSQKPGLSHLVYPYVEDKEEADGSKHERATVCPTCLNHVFSKNARYCPICGQPIENRSCEGNSIAYISDCYCRSSGQENTSNGWYPEYENRSRRLMKYSGILLDDDWAEYPYWEFTKWMIREKNTEASMDLQSALLYSIAYMDDDDNIHVVTDTAMARNAMQKDQEILLSYLKQTDGIDRTELEVLVAYDL